jgi:hypothetical protein
MPLSFLLPVARPWWVVLAGEPDTQLLQVVTGGLEHKQLTSGCSGHCPFPVPSLSHSGLRRGFEAAEVAPNVPTALAVTNLVPFSIHTSTLGTLCFIWGFQIIIVFTVKYM